MTRTCVMFTIKDKTGALQDYLATIKKHNVNMTRIESRPSKNVAFDYDFYLDFETTSDNESQVESMLSEIRDSGAVVTRIGDGDGASKTANLAWFPRKISDLDEFAVKPMDFGEDLSTDHPGFTDPVYRVRRAEIVRIAQTYRHGQPIPRVEYTQTETETWGNVYRKLRELSNKFACRQYCYIFPLLEQNCGYSDKNIPQQEDISRFLKECTGFTLRPVQGLLSSRDFLNGLAFRVFHATQYIRHHTSPLYTPEPDCCHELLGHVPLFADPDFADFSQEIGLASLGASDEDIEKLSTCYWFTVEFGMCKEGDSVKAYGAGLLSSFGELEYCVSGKPQLRPFDPMEACRTKYPITEYQPMYFVADSFQSSKEKMRHFAETMDRPFSLRYNPYTQSIDILDTRDKLVSLANNIKSQASSLASALQKITTLD